MPASDESVKNFRRTRSAGAMATPPPRVKRSDTAVSDPKQSARRKQLEHVSPRTMHYSPEADHGEGAEKCVGCEEAECIVCREADMGLKSKRKKPASPALSRVRKTAIKAKAKPKTSPASKAKARAGVAARPSKAEVPEPAKVSSALHRAATVNVPDASSSGKKVPKPIAPASPVNDDDDDQELTLEMMRARKAAHARFMRFSRSMKSKGATTACSRGMLIDRMYTRRGKWLSYRTLVLSPRTHRLSMQ